MVVLSSCLKPDCRLHIVVAPVCDEVLYGRSRGWKELDLVSKCLDDYLCGVTPKRIREALERISLK